MSGAGEQRFLVRHVSEESLELKKSRFNLKWPSDTTDANVDLDVSMGVLVETTLAMWESEKKGGIFRRHWNGFSIVVGQKLLSGASRSTRANSPGGPKASQPFEYVLHETTNFDTSREAFEKLRCTLVPLVDDCTLELTEKLLEEVVLPKPKSGEHELMQHLIEVSHRKPDVHPNWMAVFRAMLLPALVADDCETLGQLMKLQGLSPTAFVNKKGETLIHVATEAGSSKCVKKIIETSSSPKDLVSLANKMGKTSLQLAFERHQSEVILELVEAGADVSSPIAGKEFSNLYHMAAEEDYKEGISSAAFKETFSGEHEGRNVLNSTNRDGYTPLMISVRKQYLDSTFALLQAEADPNINNPKTGETVLHYAAELGNVTLLKLLIAFGTNVTAQNTQGKSVLDAAKASSAKMAPKCVQILNDVIELEEKARAELKQNEDKVLPDYPKDGLFVLSMDGGGSYVILSSLILVALMKRMKELKPNCSSQVSDYFDFFAGTSAGGILSLGIVYTKATPEVCRATVLKMADEAFIGDPTYPSSQIERVLQQLYGTEMHLADVKKPHVFAASVIANQQPPVLHLMSNYGGPRNNLKGPTERKVWEAARGTSAAPYFFAPFEEMLTDGAVMANNPTLTALTEVFALGKAEGKMTKPGFVLSLGTGYLPPKSVEDVGLVIPRDKMRLLANLIDTIAGVVNTVQMFIAQSIQTSGEEVVRARTWCESIGVPYYRFSPPITEDHNMDVRDKVILTNIMYEGHIYTLQEANNIDTVARILLSKGRN